MLVVTTDDIPGYQVRRVLGEAIGVTGRSRNPFKEGMRRLYGSGEPPVVKALTRWRLDAVDDLMAHARALGGNAIVGMRFDTRNVGEMWAEVCAYGTAVYVVPVDGRGDDDWAAASADTGTAAVMRPAERASAES